MEQVKRAKAGHSKWQVQIVKLEYISEEMSHEPKTEDISVENKIERFIRPKGQRSFSVAAKLLRLD